MAYDFKKEEKQFYRSGKKPELVDVPQMQYLAVQGQDDPNEEGGEYKQDLQLLYSLAYTIKMSKKAHIRLKIISTSWFHRLKDFGGKMALKALIMLTKKSSISFPAFGCLSL